jgi:hypothetical protein
MSIDKLINIGFKKVGEWKLTKDKLSPNLFAEENTDNILYCFILNNQPMYIGKTTQKLKRRMYGYQNPGKSQFTNIRNNQLIKDIITLGSTVEIYALSDNGLLHFGDFHLNLAAGLEDSITNTIKPKWNIQGKS